MVMDPTEKFVDESESTLFATQRWFHICAGKTRVESQRVAQLSRHESVQKRKFSNCCLCLLTTLDYPIEVTISMRFSPL